MNLFNEFFIQEFDAKFNLNVPPPDLNEEFEKLRSNVEVSIDDPASPGTPFVTPEVRISEKKSRAVSAKKKKLQETYENADGEVVEVVAESTPPANKGRKRPTSTSHSSSAKKSKVNNFIDNNGASSSVDDYASRRKSAAVNQLLNRPLAIPKADTQEVDLDHVSETLKKKNIQASSLKFGFLGLGIMGSGIVKNLINSKHKVYVWNRTEDKCRKFIDVGAEFAATPCDVMEMADITFSCVSDPQVCKDVSNN